MECEDLLAQRVLNMLPENTGSSYNLINNSLKGFTLPLKQETAAFALAENETST